MTRAPIIAVVLLKQSNMESLRVTVPTTVGKSNEVPLIEIILFPTQDTLNATSLYDK